MKIKDLTDAGLKCPHCGSNSMRSGYHDYPVMNSFICEKCGLRWLEDTTHLEEWMEYVLKKDSKEEFKRRFIWVLHLADKFDKPLFNPDSSDETTYRNFIKGKPFDAPTPKTTEEQK